MRVPINPRTNAPTGQLGYEQAVDVTAGQRALASVVDKYTQITERDQKQKEMFDVQKLVVDETNNIQQDFEAKKQVQPLGAPNFTQQVNGEYNTRHQLMVEDLKRKGYSDEAVQEYSTRLGSIRSHYVGEAINFQDKSSFAKDGLDVKELATSISQHVNKDPSAVLSGLEELKVGISHKNFDQVEQAQVYEQLKEEVLRGAREGFTEQHPEVVVGIYGGPTDPVTTSPSALPQGQEFDLPNYLSKMGVAEGTGKNKSSSATGHFQFLDATMIETYKQVYGNTGETNAQILAKRKDLSVMTKLAEKFTNDNVGKLVNANQPVNEGSVYLAHFLGPVDAIDVLSAHADATISSLISAKSIAANPKVFKNIHTAAEMIAWAQDKMGFVSPRTVDAALPVGETPTVVQAVTVPSIDAEGKTGIPILDLASGPERMQMLERARVIMNGREADAVAQQRAAHSKYINDFYNGLTDGKLGQGDLNSAYQKGLITDYDERKKAQGIIDARVKKDDDLVLFGAMLRSGAKFNPYDDKAQKAVDAGYTKAIEIEARNGGTPDPFLTALRTWERTGILPTQGGVMIRGGLISTDANTVAASASVASNMLTKNPNAFAGVEGGEEIGMAAANYAHYVDDLGLTSQEAAQKIATQNSPEFKAKVKANEPERNAFINKITGDKTHQGVNIERTINDQVGASLGFLGHITFGHYGSSRGTFTEPQKAEAKQTYLELALDNYDKTHDEGAAQAYASRQMGRFYGVESGRLLKYPATKAYPEVMGSREYIFDQAKVFVDKQAGFSIPKEDIFLQPTASGSTAAAFRAGRAPPYEVHYITHESGQAIYHIIPGKVFVADLDEARAAASVVARAQEKKVRETTRLPGVGRVGPGYPMGKE